MGEIKKNFIFNIIYQFLILIIPLITIPYVSRVLGADGIGQYSYTYSIVYYFMMFAMLGISNYGNRIISKTRDDKATMSKTFKEIYLIQFILSLVMIVIYYLYISLCNVKYQQIAIIQIIYIFSCMFDINWLFFGLEKFKLTITRNILIKILSLITIFIFVKTKSDVWKYTLILSLSTLISQIALWPFLKRNILNLNISVSDAFKHFKPCLKLFLPVIAITIYKVMDKTMIGIFSNISEVGYYENAEKIINVPNSIITALGTVMLPRMSNLFHHGKSEQGINLIERCMKFIMFLSFAMIFGLICISKDFSLLFFGAGFEKTGILIIYLSITIIFIAWGNVIRTQYLIPNENDNEYIISAFLGAIVNFIMNIILIPRYNSIGACIGTIFAEFSVVAYQTFIIRKKLPISKYIKNSFSFGIKAFIMFVLIKCVSYVNISVEIKLLLQIVLGVIIYFILNINYVIKLVDFNNLFKNILKVCKKTK